MAQKSPYFSDKSLKFLRALARNNNREWFAEHKPAYEEQVKAPFLRLIYDLAEPLAKISPHLVANPKPMGGSLFRIYRDTRFGADKRPYKTHSGASFYHAATRAIARGGDGDHGTMGRLDAPGFYFHFQPGESYCGAACGIRSRQPSSACAITWSTIRPAGKQRREAPPLRRPMEIWVGSDSCAHRAVLIPPMS